MVRVDSSATSNGYLETQVDELRAAVSTGYSRRRYDGRRDRKE
jgi:hypothetical protein